MISSQVIGATQKRPAGSRYPWVSPPRGQVGLEGERERRQAVSDLIDLYYKPPNALSSDGLIREIEVHDSGWIPGPVTERALTGAIENITDDPGDAKLLKHFAIEPFKWAVDCTKEANPFVIADFAAQTAYDLAFRQEVSYRSAEDSPNIWWQPGGGLSAQWPPPTSCFPPFSRKDLDHLRTTSSEYAKLNLPEFMQVSSYLGIKPRYAWCLDPIRPPLQAVRFAAHAITVFAPARSHVLGIELGHSATAQALSSLLPQRTVFAASIVHELPAEDYLRLLANSEVVSPALNRLNALAELLYGDASVDTVVLNIPSWRSIRFQADLVRRAQLVSQGHNQHLTGQENDRYLRMRPDDPGSHTELLVEIALEHLAANGILVVFGDVDSGVHHIASRCLRQAGLVPTKITNTGKINAQMEYESTPWRPFGVIPPTGRLVSLWRRLH